LLSLNNFSETGGGPANARSHADFEKRSGLRASNRLPALWKPFSGPIYFHLLFENSGKYEVSFTGRAGYSGCRFVTLPEVCRPLDLGQAQPKAKKLPTATSPAYLKGIKKAAG
jgi:hypothetical protein